MRRAGRWFSSRRDRRRGIRDGVAVCRSAPALCAPMFAHLDALPDPPQGALRTAFGLSSDDPPDRFLVALAALSLLAEVAEEQPLLRSWTTRNGSTPPRVKSSGSSPDGCSPSPWRWCSPFANRPTNASWWASPRCRLRVSRTMTRVRCSRRPVPGRLDERVRDRIVAETRGNPLALLELSRGALRRRSSREDCLPDAGNVVDRIEDEYRRRIASLPDATRRLMLLAAADRVGTQRSSGGRPRRSGSKGGAGASVDRAVARDRRAGQVSASAGQIRGLPCRLRLGQASGSRRACVGHRSRGRSRSSSLASGPRSDCARRGRGRRIDRFGEPCSAPWWHRGGGGVSRACGHVHSRRRRAGIAGAGGRRRKVQRGNCCRCS